jgi:hypothetical protein
VHDDVAHPGADLTLLRSSRRSRWRRTRFVIQGHEDAKGTVFLTQGERYEVTGPLKLEGAAQLQKVEFEYRPGSKVARRKSLEAESPGVYLLTPEEPALGKVIATYQNPDSSHQKLQRSVAIRFDSTLPLGLIVMIVAGIVLFGGASLSIRALLNQDARLNGELPPEGESAEPPQFMGRGSSE